MRAVPLKYQMNAETEHKNPIENPFPFLLRVVNVLVNSSNDIEKVKAKELLWHRNVSAS